MRSHAKASTAGSTQRQGSRLVGTLPLAALLLAAALVPSAASAAEPSPTSGLPDGRVYEQATPLDKYGTNPLRQENYVQAASAPSASFSTGISFFAAAGFPGGEGAQDFPSFFAGRAADGSSWATKGFFPPASPGLAGGRPLGWSEDLSVSLVIRSEPGLVPAALYWRDPDRSLHKVAAGVGAPSLAAVSADDSRVVFEAFRALTPEALANMPNVFIWDRGTEQLSLASVLNTGASPSEGAFAGPYDWFRVGGGGTPTTTGGPSLSYYTEAEHVVSTDGSRVFFTAAGEGGEAGQLYMRVNPFEAQSALDGEGECTEPAKACTVRVSASQMTGGADPLGPKPAALMFAAPDGSNVFFTSSEKLTDDAATGPLGEGNDLYRFDAESGELTDVAPDSTAANGAEVRGVLGASDDGSRVYFVANGVPDGAIANSPNPRGETAAPGNCNPLGAIPSTSGGSFGFSGACNLYLWDEGQTTFIARLDVGGGLSESDASNWQPTTLTQPGRSARTGRVSADGSAVLFRSQRQLTSYDPGGFRQLYRYSTSEGLECVSCDPTGAPPSGEPSLGLDSGSGEFSGSPKTLETRNLSADGKQVFFNSPGPLVASDLNDTQDVYEWEAEGSGSCESEDQNGGCLYLLSTGTSPQSSLFGDASASGDDVFIFTQDQLVRQDGDEMVDIYDARVGGGIAAQNAVPPVPCEGEACKKGGDVQPAFESPPTGAFTGPGNRPARTRCRKGSVRRHGRCVKQRKQHKRRHRREANSTRRASR